MCRFGRFAKTGRRDQRRRGTTSQANILAGGVCRKKPIRRSLAAQKNSRESRGKPHDLGGLFAVVVGILCDVARHKQKAKQITGLPKERYCM